MIPENSSAAPIYIHKNTSFWDVFSGVWAIALLVPLAYFPAPSVLSGHPWRVELIFPLLLILICISFSLFNRRKQFNLSFERTIIDRAAIPLCAFILWSALSYFWADSTASVAHHSLIWAVYLVFFLFLNKILVDKKLLKFNLLFFSLVIGMIAAQCIVEYTFSAKLGETFGFRFGRYAEICAAVLPLLASFVLRLKGKYLWGAIFLTAAVWLAVSFSMSRGGFLSALIGLGIFSLLRLTSKTTSSEKKRLIFAASGLIAITLLVQFPLFNSEQKKDTTLTRLASGHSDDADNSLKTNVRFLFSGVALEMFNNNKIIGVGADNFGLEFNKYRAVFSADEKNKTVAAQQEALFPERAHNEYLQILTELGLVGGIIFLIFISGIASIAFDRIKNNKNARQNILAHAAVAGIAAFLFSSMFSSFSFRLMQNGIVFFFLLALLVRNRSTAKSAASNFITLTPVLKTSFAILFMGLCLSLTVFSFLRATSQYYVYAAENEKNSELAGNLFEKAIVFDPANASANYLFGLRLLDDGNFNESSRQLQSAVDKGLNTTACYSMLASSQILSGDSQAAEATLKKTVEIFPFSTFAQIRYASVLKNAGKTAEAEKHFLIAEQINRKQAATWRIFINDGALAANKHAFSDQNADSLDKLVPAQAVPLIQAEREILHPEEVVRFNFGK